MFTESLKYYRVSSSCVWGYCWHVQGSLLPKLLGSSPIMKDVCVKVGTYFLLEMFVVSRSRSFLVGET